MPGVAVADSDGVAACYRHAWYSRKHWESVVNISRISHPVAIDTRCIVSINPGIESIDKSGIGNGIDI